MTDKKPSAELLTQAKNELDAIEQKKQSRLIKKTLRTGLRGGAGDPPPGPLPQPLYGVNV